MSLAVHAFHIRVQYGRHAAKHLKNEGFTVHQVKLFNRVLDGSRDKFVRLMRRVQLQ